MLIGSFLKQFVLRIFVISLFCAQACGSLAAAAGEVANDKSDIKISNVWARKSLSPNKNSAVYMAITNNSDHDVVLLKVSSSVANITELHKSFIDEKGIGRMTSLDKILIPAKTTVNFAPGGIHVMLIDLLQDLKTGDQIEIDLFFDGYSRSFRVKARVL